MKTTPEQTKQGHEYKSLFPTLDTTEEVLELAKSKGLAIEQNEIHSLFMIYHNTLLHTLQN